MRRIVPKAKFNLYQKRGHEDAHILMYLHYMNGNNSCRFKKTVPATKVLPEFWNKKTQRAMLNRRNPQHHILVNELLDKLAQCIEGIWRDHNCGSIDPEQINVELSYRMGWVARPVEAVAEAPTLLGFIDDFIAERAGGKRGTEKILKTWANLLREFCTDYYGRLLNFDEIDQPFFAAFKTWCYKPPREHSISYFSKGISVLRQFMRAAEQRKLHSNRQFEFFTVKKEPTTQIALTFEELERLDTLDLKDCPGQEWARDLFLIGAYTGLRYSDFIRIRPENIKPGNEGKTIDIVTQKTNTLVSIPLFPVSERILEKYNFNPPQKTNQKMNEYLKEVGKKADLNALILNVSTAGGVRKEESRAQWELLTTHVARRSFATNFYRAGYPPAILMMITGHATEKQFMQYIKIGAQENAARMAKMNKERTLTVVDKKAVG